MTKGKKGGRVFEIVTQPINKETGEELMSLEKALTILKKYKSIDRYAIILHDKDYLTEEEIKEKWQKEKVMFDKEALFNAWSSKKFKREPHFHIVFETPRNYYLVDNIAKWFSIAPNFVRVKTGQGALIDSVMYLTHEGEKQQDLGKHLYSDGEITSNFDFRSEIEAHSNEKNKYGKNLTAREKLRLDVLFNGLTLKQAREKDPFNYEKDLNILKRNRGDYLSNQKPPQGRMTFYISGKGGVGKDLLARGLARQMFPNQDDDEVFFEVGAKGAEFENYDGQPVIIWSDVRAYDLLTRWGRGNLLTMLDPFPKSNKKQNVKYSSTSLLNKINIMTGPDDFRDFLGGIMGQYVDSFGLSHHGENIEQIYRRVPIIVPMREEDFDILLNKGVMENSREFEQYYLHERIIGNLQKVHSKLRDTEKILEIEGKVLAPVVDATKRITVRDVEDVDLSEFADYGKSRREVGEYEYYVQNLKGDEISGERLKLVEEEKEARNQDGFVDTEKLEKVYGKWRLFNKYHEVELNNPFGEEE